MLALPAARRRLVRSQGERSGPKRVWTNNCRRTLFGGLLLGSSLPALSLSINAGT